MLISQYHTIHFYRLCQSKVSRIFPLLFFDTWQLKLGFPNRILHFWNLRWIFILGHSILLRETFFLASYLLAGSLKFNYLSSLWLDRPSGFFPKFLTNLKNLYSIDYWPCPLFGYDSCLYSILPLLVSKIALLHWFANCLQKSNIYESKNDILLNWIILIYVNFLFFVFIK